MELKIGDKVSYTWGWIIVIETVIKMRGEGENRQAKLHDIGWVSVNMPTLKLEPPETPNGIKRNENGDYIILK